MCVKIWGEDCSDNICITMLVIMLSKVRHNCEGIHSRFIGGSCTAVICPSSLGRLQGSVLFYIGETATSLSILWLISPWISENRHKKVWYSADSFLFFNMDEKKK